MNSNKFAFILFVLSVLSVAFLLGYLVHRQNFFPAPQMEQSWSDLSELFQEKKTPWYDAWYYKQIKTENKTLSADSSNHTELTLLTGVTANKKLFIKTIDSRGETVHQWDIDWFNNWPNPQHIPEKRIPKSDPGTMIHGATVLPDGDLIFNYESLGMVRMDACSDIVWRLPYRTHHSIHIDEQGFIWTNGVIDRNKAMPRYPNHQPEFQDYTVVKISPDGNIIKEISVFDLITKNGYQGLLYLSTRNDFSTTVSGDTLHLNDVEVFPTSMPEGVFRHGDLMISLRNINTVIVFDPDTLQIRYIKTGAFIRQHDPDFLDGNTIVLFDNNNLVPRTEHQFKMLRAKDIKGQSSKIVSVSADRHKIKTIFEGTEEMPFFTNVMGKQQLLGNDHILITDSRNGHAFEINPEGNIVWRYLNIIDDNLVGLLTEAQRLRPEYDRQFFANAAANCAAGKQ